MAILRAGGTALDAVVATIRQVEANPEDHSVGYGGLPNLLGEVELDASIMDGRNLATGAVAALKGYQDAISLAQVVLEQLPHVLVVGAGAERLAIEAGFPNRDLLTEAARSIWQRPFPESGEENGFITKTRELAREMSRDPERPHDSHGTVNVIARDATGNLVSGVSTSGWAWKFPGRVGDSPIIGAGNYADNRWGASTCTGRGEMAQRCCTAHSVVAFMRAGMPLAHALRLAAEDLHRLEDDYRSDVNIIGVDCDGRHAGASTDPGKSYIAMTADSDAISEIEHAYVRPPTANAH